MEPIMRLAILDDYHDAALKLADWQRLAGRVEAVSFREHIAGADALHRTLADFDAVVVMRERTPLPGSLLSRLPRLKLIVTTGPWNASIDIETATRLGIQVCGTRDVGHLTAELTLGLMLALSRQLPFEEQALCKGQWQVRLGEGLHGKTIGLLGLGRLGQQVARFSQMLGMQTIAWSQNLDAATAAAASCRLVQRDELLRAADYVTIHLRLSDRTRGLLGARELALMKPTAYLINTSRGPIVDEEALNDALARRAIAGAALDVYGTEPLPPEALIRKLDNVILLPHLGYVAKENFEVMYGDSLDAVEAYLDGRVVRGLNELAAGL
jgi:phosphoglycerate dehydrogenase-like enzyme